MPTSPQRTVGTTPDPSGSRRHTERVRDESDGRDIRYVRRVHLTVTLVLG